MGSLLPHGSRRFLETRDNDHKCLKLLSWNINAAKNKLENNDVQTILLSSDIVFLNEIKTSECVSLPGFKCFPTQTILIEVDVLSC